MIGMDTIFKIISILDTSIPIIPNITAPIGYFQTKLLYSFSQTKSSF